MAMDVAMQARLMFLVGLVVVVVVIGLIALLVQLAQRSSEGALGAAARLATPRTEARTPASVVASWPLTAREERRS